MGVDDLISGETAFVAAATAAVFSPRTRETLRKGAVFGVAGALKAGDVLAGAARGAIHGVRGEDQDATGAAGSTEVAPTRRRAAPARTPRSANGKSSTRARRTTKPAGPSEAR